MLILVSRYFIVEFQSYPSMKWKAAQFKVCVVQQVSDHSNIGTECMKFIWCQKWRHLTSSFPITMMYTQTLNTL